MNKFFLSTLFLLCTATAASVQAMHTDPEATTLVHWHQQPRDTQAQVSADAELAKQLAGITITSGPMHITTQTEHETPVESKTPAHSQAQTKSYLASCWECFSGCFSWPNDFPLRGFEDIKILERFISWIYPTPGLCNERATLLQLRKTRHNDDATATRITCVDNCDENKLVAHIDYSVATSEIIWLHIDDAVIKNIGFEYLLLYAALMDMGETNPIQQAVYKKSPDYNYAANDPLVLALKQAGFTESANDTNIMIVDPKTFVERHARNVFITGRKLFIKHTNESDTCFS